MIGSSALSDACSKKFVWKRSIFLALTIDPSQKKIVLTLPWILEP